VPDKWRSPAGILAIAAYTTAAIVLGYTIHSLLFATLSGSDDEDRPPIIVRDGSMIIEGGDQKNPKKGKISQWDQVANSSQHWKPQQPHGHKVAGFTVYVGGVVDPANCSQTTLPADAVQIDYTTASATTMSFHIRHTPNASGNKDEPQVDADDPSGLTTGVSTLTVTGYPQLLADSGGKGWITKVIATDASGTATACSFAAPTDDARPLVRVTVVPERK